MIVLSAHPLRGGLFVLICLFFFISAIKGFDLLVYCSMDEKSILALCWYQSHILQSHLLTSFPLMVLLFAGFASSLFRCCFSLSVGCFSLAGSSSYHDSHWPDCACGFHGLSPGVMMRNWKSYWGSHLCFPLLRKLLCAPRKHCQ